MEFLDEVLVDFLDQLEMWKLEECFEIYEELVYEKEIDDLFDMKVFYEKF